MTRTCVNVGCVPSKALIAAADSHHHAHTHRFAGIARSNGNDTEPDLATIVAQKDELVAALRQAKYLDLVADYGFQLRHGTARFADPETLEVGGQRLRAATYLIATGAHLPCPASTGSTASTSSRARSTSIGSWTRPRAAAPPRRCRRSESRCRSRSR